MKAKALNNNERKDTIERGKPNLTEFIPPEMVRRVRTFKININTIFVPICLNIFV